MIDLEIAAPLAAALAARGYDSLTPVQQAVLAPEAQGRDALVSAQTGSGKTVAFGIAIADTLLRGADRLLYADTPMALVIAPTRELALQVARELEWLYAAAGAQIATCVGGMDYRTEKRALDRGAHIVVGTPGRLRDHIERRSLDLSGLRAAVLDEADEMLDLGFREDLEFILGAAPADRRTLMFSATVSKEIAALATEYQTNALRIQTQGEARQHVDIDYKAMSVAVRDREHAIFNVLRFYEAQTALVFCKTRANVNNLMARMGNRGFQVVALSGELSQQERTHALQALRDGRARVCVATDVAARGIDLPGLELVIHADLPSNSETLLHRSGRTGRAGKKGVSALIVLPAEFKKAQRLLQGAKVVADWIKPPSADEVQEKDDMRLLDHPTLTAGIGDEAAMVDALLTRFGAPVVAAGFIRLWREGRAAPDVLSDQVVPAAGPPRDRGEFGASVWYALSVGRSGRAEARWLLPKICDAGGITKDAIGAIRVQEDRTFVQIAADRAGKFGAHLELEIGVTMDRLPGEPDLDRPERSPRKPAPRADADRPAYVPKPPRIIDDSAEAASPAPRPTSRPTARPTSRPTSSRPVAVAPAPQTTVARDAPEAPPPAAEVPRTAAAAPARKPYVRRDAAAEPMRQPVARRDEDAAPRKAYGKRSDPEAPRQTYAKRDDAGPPRKPSAKRDDAAAADKSYPKRDDADAPRKSYVKRVSSEIARKPYAPRAEGAAPGARWAPRSDGPAKPRSAGFKSHGPADGKPARAAGSKSHAAEGRSFAKPSEGKPFAKPARAKPAPVRVDARDTSKRFVPPKKK